MQYLVNKTDGVLNLDLGLKVGKVHLEPYQALPMSVEQWDAKAFNSIRLYPHWALLCERVPAHLAEKRKAYLELHSPQILEQKEKEKDNLKKQIKTIEKELDAEKKILKDAKEELSQLEVALGADRAKLRKNADDTALLEAVKALEAEFLEKSQVYDMRVKEFNEISGKLEALKEDLDKK